MTLQSTDTTFQNDIKKGKVLVDFWAPWCGPCKMLTPILEELENDFKDDITIAKLNIDENPNIASQFGIMSIPTMIFFENGQPIEKISGYHPKEVLSEYLAEKLTK